MKLGVAIGEPPLAELVAAAVVGLAVGVGDGGEHDGNEDKNADEERLANDKITPKNVHGNPAIVQLYRITT